MALPSSLEFILRCYFFSFNLTFYFSLSCAARYCDDPEQAEVFYHHALVLVPSNGNENLFSLMNCFKLNKDYFEKSWIINK